MIAFCPRRPGENLALTKVVYIYVFIVSPVNCGVPSESEICRAYPRVRRDSTPTKEKQRRHQPRKPLACLTVACYKYPWLNVVPS